LRLDGVRVATAGGGLILDLPDLTLAPGECLGVAGPSGAGKTTLIQAVAGLLSLAAGRVWWGTAEVSALPRAARDAWRRRTLGLVFQDFALIPELSARANILVPAGFERWRVPAALADKAQSLAAAAGVGALLGRRAGLLSRGEQQRVALCRALLGDPALLLADEPTASLDADAGRAVAAVLVDGARRRGASLIAVSHDPDLLARMDRVIHLDHGRLAATGER